jgi:hypothetical protein
MNQSLNLGTMTTTGFRIPPDKALNYQNPMNTVSNPSPRFIFSILIGKHGTSIPGGNINEQYGTSVLPQTKPGFCRAMHLYPKES